MNAKTVTVNLSEPIPRDGDKKKPGIPLSEIVLRRPTAGDLRKLKLIELSELNPDILFELVPRLAVNTVTAADIQLLSPPDMGKLFKELNGFFTE